MQTRRPNRARPELAQEAAARIARASRSRARRGAAIAFVAAMVGTGCGHAEPQPVIDAAPQPVIDAAPPVMADAAPAPVDAAPDAMPVDAAPPILCDPTAPAYDGPLCGPPGRPCVVLADSRVSGNTLHRGDAPAVAVDARCLPHVTFTEIRGSYLGHYGRLSTAGGWVVEQLPFPVRTIAAAVTPEGSPVLLAEDDGEGQYVTLYTRGDAAGEWISHDMPGKVFVNAAGMQRDSSGALHVVLKDNHKQVHYARLPSVPDGRWEAALLDEERYSRQVLALSPDEVPHTAGWRQDVETGGFLLRWTQGADDVETVASQPYSFNLTQHALAVGPADAVNPGGRPHVLFMLLDADTGVQQIFYATRTGEDSWTTTVVDDSEQPGAYCNGEPPPGETCRKHLRVIGAVAGPAGDVRLFYAKHYIRFTASEVCESSLHGESCQSVSQDRRTAELYVAWPDETGAIARAAVTETFLASIGTVALDRMGTVHIALYGDEPGVGELLVRYLRIGHGGL